MFEISVEAQFSAAHRLRNYKGKCENMHGHNWKVKAVITGRKLNSQGMVMDFSELKKKLNAAIMRLDHKYLNDINYFKKANPTSENIARYIYDEMKNIQKKAPGAKKGARRFFQPQSIFVWETDTSCATYYE